MTRGGEKMSVDKSKDLERWSHLQKVLSIVVAFGITSQLISAQSEFLRSFELQLTFRLVMLTLVDLGSIDSKLNARNKTQ